MARWTGEWLSGSHTGLSTGEEEPQRWRGERLGLPEAGPGSAAGGGSRVLALVFDLVMASLLTSLFVHPVLQDTAAMQNYNLWSILVWAVITVLPVAFFGFTPGMAMTGVGVARLDGKSMVGLWRAVVRGALTFLLIPAAIRNVDGRSWLDRLTGTVVVRLR
ncbi:RDD family protein [Amycolatopsis pithecellobii]|uniref:RDD family protein n=1 Tax=Amycolatopsis pithecellobii TaxID=664692 RepID=A0A6N7ZCK7_9PSEU|nr:RDD family protein [Amycolatopsis pithecellobii]MTD59425.1 RDD family protein [Amycolatopsis pithecellobii]